MTALATTSTSTLARFEPLPVTAIERLFERLTGQLGGRVADLYAGTKPEVVQREWAAGLAGYAKQELARGLEAVRTRPFAPNLGEFCRLCRPALDPEYAWYEAQDGLRARDRGEMGAWSHPAVYRAAIVMGDVGVNVRSGSFPGARKRWEMVLSRELAAGWGDEVPEPALRIKSEPTLLAIPSDVKQKLAAISRKLSRKE